MDIKVYQHRDLSTWLPFDLAHHHHVVLEITNPYYLKNDGEVVYHDYGVIDKGDRENDRAHAAAGQKLAREMNHRSFDESIKGRRFTRYVTKWYVSISEDEAHRQAEIDKTPVEQIGITPDVEILHTTGNFTFWSDGKITAHVSNIPYGGCLTPDAVRIIDDVRGSDGGYVEGGLLLLTKIARVLDRQALSFGEPRGVYAREKVEEWFVEWVDGTHGKLYIHTAGYFEGYQFDVYTSLEGLAQATTAPEADGISDFSGFDYDPELGYVKRQD